MHDAQEWGAKIFMILVLIGVISWVVNKYYETKNYAEKEAYNIRLRHRALRVGIDMETVEDYMDYYGHDSKEMLNIMMNPGVLEELKRNAAEAL